MDRVRWRLSSKANDEFGRLNSVMMTMEYGDDGDGDGDDNAVWRWR